ncbi:predicted protein [Naegleria gruberi]|uniref:Predicted protein n=1 Tax=Naegleria gruberi TaxID=5762 RepID=D2VM94_NAEGR|nr:uncharacterized protein NAEGRDRAFT_50718 [Naegleria gruberi]EFC42022.1 predicted protein [Naegleria gruberi]|eukprot:XP_002674766.1 predicted protein [Naegleria gruberi strain NEG-M]
MKNELSRYTSELSTEDFDFVKQWKGPIKIDKRYLPEWVKTSSAIVQLLVTDEKKKKKHGKSAASQEDDEHVLKHASGIKIVVEGYEEITKHDSINVANSPSHTSISINSKGILTPKKSVTPTVDIVKAINSKTSKPKEAKSADSVTSPLGDEADFLMRENIQEDNIPPFVETQHILTKKEKPSLCIRGLDLGYTSERQRQQLIVWKNKKLTFRDLDLPEDVEEYLDDMDDPFIYDEFLSFLTDQKD